MMNERDYLDQEIVYFTSDDGKVTGVAHHNKVVDAVWMTFSESLAKKGIQSCAPKGAIEVKHLIGKTEQQVLVGIKPEKNDAGILAVTFAYTKTWKEGFDGSRLVANPAVCLMFHTSADAKSNKMMKELKCVADEFGGTVVTDSSVCLAQADNRHLRGLWGWGKPVPAMKTVGIDMSALSKANMVLFDRGDYSTQEAYDYHRLSAGRHDIIRKLAANEHFVVPLLIVPFEECVAGARVIHDGFPCSYDARTRDMLHTTAVKSRRPQSLLAKGFTRLGND